MSAELDLARHWVAKARHDLLNADNNLRSADVPYDTVCFHCQQAAEKLLKAFLVAEGQIAPRTHDLLHLLELVATYEASAKALEEAATNLTPYAVEMRYPEDGSDPVRADAEEARTCAETIMEWFRQRRPVIVSD